jgi:DNA polymerase I-like protein with 3'-5' exonuclease and polymerase domains
MIQPSFPELMPESSWRPPDSFPEISDAKFWSLDVETYDPFLKTRGPGFLRKDSFAVGIAIHVDDFSGYWPVRHFQGTNFAPNVVFDWLADQVKHFHGELYGAHLLYDEESLWFEGVRFHDDVVRRDVQIAEPLIDSETAEGYSLEVLSRKYLGVGKEESLLRDAAQSYVKGYKDKGCKRPMPLDPKGDLYLLPPEYVGRYAEADVDRPRRIYEKQAKIIGDQDLWDIFNLESSLIPILLRMRINGVRVDLEQAEVLNKRLQQEIDKHSLQISRIVGFDPNVDSSQDLKRAYEVANFKFPEFDIAQRLRYTALGNPSFTADWYQEQSDPLSKAIAKKKKLATLQQDFVIGDVIKESVDGRIHAQFHQLRQDDKGTRDGRFSSTNPNLTQIPARHQGCDEDCPDDCSQHIWGKPDPNWAQEVRKLFIPDEGKIWYKGDYMGQEPRLMLHFASLCHLPGAAEAVAAFRKNPLTDYHALTTSIVNEKSGRHFKRKQIKSVNLAIVYGAGLMKICKMLGVSIEEGKEIMREYRLALPFVQGLSNMAMKTAEQRGFVKTLLNRRCRFDFWEPVPNSREEMKFKVMGLPRHLAEQKWPGRRLQRANTHKALNKIIQPSAADQTKKSVQVLYYEHRLLPQLIVHDELDSSVSDLAEARIFKMVQETCVLLEIPVICDAFTGSSWGAAKEPLLLEAA